MHDSQLRVAAIMMFDCFVVQGVKEMHAAVCCTTRNQCDNTHPSITIG